MLSDEEIIRRLRAIRMSPHLERSARRAPSLNGVIRASGISKDRVYRICRGEAGLGPKSRKALQVLEGYGKEAKSSIPQSEELRPNRPVSMGFRVKMPTR